MPPRQRTRQSDDAQEQVASPPTPRTISDLPRDVLALCLAPLEQQER